MRNAHIVYGCPFIPSPLFLPVWSSRSSPVSDKLTFFVIAALLSTSIGRWVFRTHAVVRSWMIVLTGLAWVTPNILIRILVNWRLFMAPLPTCEPLIPHDSTSLFKSTGACWQLLKPIIASLLLLLIPSIKLQEFCTANRTVLMRSFWINTAGHEVCPIE